MLAPLSVASRDVGQATVRVVRVRVRVWVWVRVRASTRAWSGARTLAPTAPPAGSPRLPARGRSSRVKVPSDSSAGQWWGKSHRTQRWDEWQGFAAERGGGGRGRWAGAHGSAGGGRGQRSPGCGQRLRTESRGARRARPPQAHCAAPRKMAPSVRAAARRAAPRARCAQRPRRAARAGRMRARRSAPTAARQLRTKPHAPASRAARCSRRPLRARWRRPTRAARARPRRRALGCSRAPRVTCERDAACPISTG